MSQIHEKQLLARVFTRLFSQSSPCCHSSCTMSSLRGLRNGIYYGGKIRFMHALVMTILFRKGSLHSKVKHIITLTLEHARSLGTYVVSYKSIVCFLNRIRGVQSPVHSLISGAICGGLIFGEKSSVNTQIVLYLFSRVLLGSAEALVKKGVLPDWQFYPHLATICWSLVMFLFEDNESSLQTSLTTSMKFLYKDSDQKVNYWTQFLPFTVPSNFQKFFPFRPSTHHHQEHHQKKDKHTHEQDANNLNQINGNNPSVSLEQPFGGNKTLEIDNQQREQQ